MPATPLDPNAALVVIDLQKGIAAIPLAEPIAAVTVRAAKLAAAFRAAGLPVVLVNVDGVAPRRTEHARGARDFPADFAELLPELDRQPGDLLVTKQTPGAFTNTGLEAELRRRGVTHIVLAGVATSLGVESTARFAFELGFDVVFATDAMTDRDAETHASSVERIFPRLGVRTTSAEVVAALEARPRP